MQFFYKCFLISQIAVHTIHPIAGQGFNLGMADAKCIVKQLKQAVESGMGIDGTVGLEYASQK